MANEEISRSILNERDTAIMDGYLKTTVFDMVALDTKIGMMMMTNPYNVKRNGGRRIKILMRVGHTDGLTSFGDNDTVDPQRKPVLQEAYATFKQALSSIRIGWVEEAENRGSDSIVNILKARTDATIQDCKEDFRTMMWGDGTGNGGKDMMGITGLIPTTPTTGIAMGYDRAIAANGFMHPWVWNVAHGLGPYPTDEVCPTPAAITCFGDISDKAATGLQYFDYAVSATQSDESPSDSYWLSDETTYSWYKTLYPIYADHVEIPMSGDTLKWGWDAAMICNRPWIYDTVANGAPANEVRLVNKKYLFMVQDSGAWWVWSDWKEPFNQPSRAKFMFVRGQNICTNFMKQAVLQFTTGWQV